MRNESCPAEKNGVRIMAYFGCRNIDIARLTGRDPALIRLWKRSKPLRSAEQRHAAWDLMRRLEAARIRKTGPASREEINHALIMYIFGISKRQIATILGRNRMCADKWFNPEYRAKRTRYRAERRAKERAERKPKSNDSPAMRQRLRRMAREEARATGADVNQIYVRWQCA